MGDQEQNQAVMLIVILGSLGVAVSVVSLGMGFVNILSADANVRLSALALVQGKPNWALSAPPPATRFVDINFLREEITAREDKSASLRRQIDQEAKEVGIQKKLAETLQSAQDPAPDTAAAAEPADAQAILHEIAGLDAKIVQLHKQLEDSRRIDLARWIPPRIPGEKRQWIDCGKDGIVIQPQDRRFSLPEWKSSGGGSITGMTYTVMLVRPSGLDTCAAVRKTLEANRVAYDMAPVEEGWQFVFH